MEPMTMAIIAGTAVSAISGIVQSKEAAKARRASQAELDRIDALFEAIKPPGYDLTINDPPELHKERLESPRFRDKLKDVDFNLSKFKPEDLKVIGKYSPQTAAFIKEEAPKLIEQTEGMKKGREAQMAALRRMTEIGDRDFDPVLQEKLETAKRSAQNEAQSRQRSIMQDFSRRGMAGSGMDLAAQIGGNAAMSDTLAQANLSAQSEAYKNRLNALMQGAELGGRISGEDMDLQQRNANTINSFNQRMSAGRQDWENRRVGGLNEAEKFNLGMGQEIENQNVGNRNKAEMYNRERMDEIARYNRLQDERERDREDRLAQWKYGADERERDYANRNAIIGYDMKNSERDRINHLRQKMYENELDKASGRAGMASQRRSDIMQNARDRNSAYSGITGAITSGAMAYGQEQSQQKRDQDYYDYLERKRKQYEEDQQKRYP